MRIDTLLDTTSLPHARLPHAGYDQTQVDTMFADWRNQYKRGVLTASEVRGACFDGRLGTGYAFGPVDDAIDTLARHLDHQTQDHTRNLEQRVTRLEQRVNALEARP